jgi:hypothetical protein
MRIDMRMRTGCWTSAGLVFYLLALKAHTAGTWPLLWQLSEQYLLYCVLRCQYYCQRAT